MDLTEKHIRSQVRKVLLKELTGKFKDQVEIIYRDKNMVCMIPKSQMTSHIYGQGAKWCQVDKSGFDGWSKQGLLIRFLFKNGRKVRFTYFIGEYASRGFYWANETGYHILSSEHGEKNQNPFNAKSNRKPVSSMEKDVLNIIKNDIPEECKNAVLEFIKKNQEKYNYCYSDVEYKPASTKEKEKEFRKIVDYYTDVIYDLRDKNPYVLINPRFDRQKKEFTLNYSNEFGLNNNYLSKEENFKDAKSLENRIVELLKLYSQEPVFNPHKVS